MAMFWKDIGWCCRTQRPLHSADLFVITHLYQPIVGTTAVALYLTLYHQLPFHRGGTSEIYAHSYLLKLCSLSFDQLLESRYLLEGVGLLNTFEIQDKEKSRHYEYEIIPPLTPAKFFQSDILSITLFNLLGKERYLAIRKQLIDSQSVESAPVSFKTTNITKSFQEVFGSLSPIEMAKAVQIEKEAAWEMGEVAETHLEGKPPQLDESDDLSMIRMRLNSLVDEAVWTDQMVAELREIRFLYQLDDWDLLKALQNPYVTRHGWIDLERLRSYIKSEYRLRFGGPPLITRKQNGSRTAEITASSQSTSSPHQEGLTEEEKHFQQLAEISPIELLSAYQGGAQIPDSDVELVEGLISQYGLLPGVINVLLEYVLLKYDYKLPRKLVEKIAGQWKRLGIKTVQEALEQARKENWDIKKKRSDNKAPRSQPKREEKLPRSVAKQMQTRGEQAHERKELTNEELSEKQARLQAKLKLMTERLNSRKQERESLS